MTDNMGVKEKPKRGRRPKPDAEKCTELICLNMWEDEYDLFVEAAGSGGMARFLRDAVHELVGSRLKTIDPPRPVTRGLGTQFTMLLTEKEKADFDEAASKRFRLPLSGLIRAAGKGKVDQGHKG